MAYIGREPQVGNFQVCDAISVVNGQAAYTMQVNSVNVSPETANHCLVSLNGVLQKSSGASPSFTISGSTITFASNLATGDVIDFIHILGSVLDLGVPSDGTVSGAKLASTAITEQTAETSIATDDLILISDTSASGALKKMTRANFVSGVGGTNTPAFSAEASSQQSIPNGTDTDLVFGTELFDTDNAFASNVFTVPSGKAGKYYLFSQSGRENWDSDRFVITIVKTTSGGSASFIAVGETHDGQGYEITQAHGVVDLAVGDVIKVKVYQDSGSTRNVGTGERTVFQGFKLL